MSYPLRSAKSVPAEELETIKEQEVFEETAKPKRASRKGRKQLSFQRFGCQSEAPAPFFDSEKFVSNSGDSANNGGLQSSELKSEKNGKFICDICNKTFTYKYNMTVC